MKKWEETRAIISLKKTNPQKVAMHAMKEWAGSDKPDFAFELLT